MICRTSPPLRIMYAHMGVDAGDASLFHRARKGVEPALGLPLERVLAPDGLVGVHSAQVDDDL